MSGSRQAEQHAAEATRMISYAQNHEDVVLERIFRNRHDGFFVDVGACHPVHDSVTQHFHLRGWRGVNVEPQPELFSELVRARPEDVNLELCVGSSRSRATLYVTGDSGTSTLDSALAEQYREQGRINREFDVAVVTLDDIWQQHVHGRRVDFLKIDVEGLELQVLQGADFELVDPLVIVIEAVHPETCIAAHMAWEHLLLGHYRPFLFDGINRFYHRLDFPLPQELNGVPANVLDNFVSYREYLTEQACHHLSAENKALQEQLRNFRRWLEHKDAALEDAARAYAALQAHVDAMPSLERKAAQDDPTPVADGPTRD